MRGTTIRVIKGDTRSLDDSSSRRGSSRYVNVVVRGFGFTALGLGRVSLK